MAAFLLPLTYGVWIPDLIGHTRMLATATTSSGYRFHVTHVWNRYDFYTTKLIINAPDGSVREPYLDGDDSKSWSVPIAINESNRVVTVTLNGDRTKSFHW